jgi:hypothetical protein
MKTNTLNINGEAILHVGHKVAIEVNGVCRVADWSEHWWEQQFAVSGVVTSIETAGHVSIATGSGNRLSRYPDGNVLYIDTLHLVAHLHRGTAAVKVLGEAPRCVCCHAPKNGGYFENGKGEIICLDCYRKRDSQTFELW